jgi:uncharacterized protein YndB with AHSA1/START domain
MNEPLIIERIFNAPLHKVWSAITDKDEMKHWYFDLSGFRAEPGFEFSFVGCDETENNMYNHLCRVTEVIPMRKLAYTWQYEGYAGCSTVIFELFDEGGKTRLKLTHEGLETFPQDHASFARKSFSEGWNAIIGKSLADYLSK